MNNQHLLNSKWVLYYHDSYDKNWNISSFQNIIEISYTNQLIAINESMPEFVIKNGMLFLFRQGINPFWEDPKNKDGGFLSFKLDNSVVHNVWKSFVYGLCGETLFKNVNLNSFVNGISISPKKSFCIIKIWMSGSYFNFSKDGELNSIKFLDSTDLKFTPFCDK